MNSSDAQVAGILALIVGVVIAVIVVGLIINAIICFVLSSCLKRIPAAHRKMEPGSVWLLMIPCFPIVWNFVVFPKISESFKSYFDSVGDESVGDCAAGIGMGYAGCIAANMVLSVAAQKLAILGSLGSIVGLVAFVLFIVYLVKAVGMKNKIPMDAA